jgi:hypothetical protein
MLPVVLLSKKNLTSRLAKSLAGAAPESNPAAFQRPKRGGRPAGFPSTNTVKLLDVHAGNWLGDRFSLALTITILYVLDQERYSL